MLVDARMPGCREAGDRPQELAYSPTSLVPLRTLISEVVRHEVLRHNAPERTNRFARVLTPELIERGTRSGHIAVRSGTARISTDPAEAVRTAVRAFEDGLYYVFVDDLQHEDLDDLVSVRPDTKLLFVRLVALAGG